MSSVACRMLIQLRWHALTSHRPGAQLSVAVCVARQYPPLLLWLKDHPDLSGSLISRILLFCEYYHMISMFADGIL